MPQFPRTLCGLCHTTRFGDLVGGSASPLPPLGSPQLRLWPRGTQFPPTLPPVSSALSPRSNTLVRLRAHTHTSPTPRHTSFTARCWHLVSTCVLHSTPNLGLAGLGLASNHLHPSNLTNQLQGGWCPPSLLLTFALSHPQVRPRALLGIWAAQAPETSPAPLCLNGLQLLPATVLQLQGNWISGARRCSGFWLLTSSLIICPPCHRISPTPFQRAPQIQGPASPPLPPPSSHSAAPESDPSSCDGLLLPFFVLPPPLLLSASCLFAGGRGSGGTGLDLRRMCG